MTLKTAVKIEWGVSILFFLLTLPFTMVALALQYLGWLLNVILFFFNIFVLRKIKQFLLRHTEEAHNGKVLDYYMKNGTCIAAYKLLKEVENDWYERFGKNDKIGSGVGTGQTNENIPERSRVDVQQ